MNSTILLVDDDRNLLQGYIRALRGQPFRVLTAENASEAAHVLKTQPVDLVVSDEHMPGMSGTEFLAWVAQAFPNVVRIVLTGQPSVSSAMRAINEGHAFRYLTKPCQDFELAMTIRDGLDQAASTATTSPSTT